MRSGKTIALFCGTEGQSVFPIFSGRERFVADEAGATMTEYGFLLLFVALVAIAAVRLLGANVLPLFNVNQFFQ
jgi:Flp pilus assembly pilin Flp